MPIHDLAHTRLVDPQHRCEETDRAVDILGALAIDRNGIRVAVLHEDVAVVNDRVDPHLITIVAR
jgi:hypothetical protein